MTYPFVRQIQYAVTAGFGALVLIETTALADAHNPTFEGNWLVAVGAIVFAAIALWLTCVGSLRSDRDDRHRSTSRTSGRGGPVYFDTDGYMHVH